LLLVPLLQAGQSSDHLLRAFAVDADTNQTLHDCYTTCE
jgi:hypothetical protein